MWEMNSYTLDQSHLGSTLQSTPQIIILPPCPIRTTMPITPSKVVDADFDHLIGIQFATFVHLTETGNSPCKPYIDGLYPGSDTGAGQVGAIDHNVKPLHTNLQ
jgi:hypothetical protein